MAKEVCVLFMCDNFLFSLGAKLYAQTSLCAKAMRTKPFVWTSCFMQSSKTMGGGKWWAKFDYTRGFIQSTCVCHKHPPSSHQLNDNVHAQGFSYVTS